MSDGDPELGGLLARLFREKPHEAGGDAVRCLGGEGDGLARDACDGDAADVAAVRELFEIIVGQWHGDSSFNKGIADKMKSVKMAVLHLSVLPINYAPKSSSSTAMQRAW